MMINLDTHILIFALSGELRPDERLARSRWSVSSIVLWELAKLVHRWSWRIGKCCAAEPGSRGRLTLRWRRRVWISGATRRTKSSRPQALCMMCRWLREMR